MKSKVITSVCFTGSTLDASAIEQAKQCQIRKSKNMGKKILFLCAGLLCLLTSCSDDEDPVYVPPIAQSFTFDDNGYTLIASQSITEIKQQNVLTVDGNTYDRSAITIIGMNGFIETATVSFDLYYRDGQTVAGTYPIFDDIDGEAAFDEFISPLQRGCLGWTSMGVVFISTGADPLQANNPSGTVTVTVNSANNYTIQYDGNYKLYNDGFDFVRNVPCSINVTGDVTVN